MPNIKRAAGMRRPYLMGLIIGCATLVLLLAAASQLNASQYGALAATIQAVAVIPAMLLRQ
jgi:hypothetical protein